MNDRNRHRRIESTEIAERTPRRPKRKSKALYYVILLILVGILVFSAIKIISYFKQQSDSEGLQNDLIDDFVIPADTSDDPATDTDESDEEEKPEEKPYVPQPDQIEVNFDAMIAKYPDVVGYIYSANTGINSPIVRGKGNDFYLTHTYDGSVNNNGVIFMEDLNSSNFSDSNTLIYGHNMKSGLMFAALCKYKDQSFYDAHPYMYIYTPNQDYRLDLFAGFVCDHDDEVYSLSLSSSQLSSMAAKSTFKANIGVPTGNVVTLSTCSYEHDNARYVVMGELVPID